MPTEDDYPAVFGRAAREGKRQTLEIRANVERELALRKQARAVHVVHRRQGLRASVARLLRRLADWLESDLYQGLGLGLGLGTCIPSTTLETKDVGVTINRLLLYGDVLPDSIRAVPSPGEPTARGEPDPVVGADEPGESLLCLDAP